MLLSFRGKNPQITAPSMIADTATVIGSVMAGPKCSIWHGAVVRGDFDSVVIGEGSSIQDNCVVHVARDYPTRIGSYVTVGHLAMLHGCTIGDRTLIGIGSIILDGAEIGEECIIGAGAVVAPRMKVPPRSMVLGVPGKVVRQLSDTEAQSLIAHALEYWRLAQGYLE